jgi:DNA replication protein DnaC
MGIQARVENRGASGGGQTTLRIISRAYEHHRLMLTSNLAFEEWTEIFGSEQLIGALLGRLTHRCPILEANAESYRLRQARKRSNWKPASRLESTPKEKDK